MVINDIDLNVGYVEMSEMPDFQGKPKEVEKAVQYAIAGLLSDGAHHKQWCLEEVLRALGINLEELKIALREGDYEWEEGIAP